MHIERDGDFYLRPNHNLALKAILSQLISKGLFIFKFEDEKRLNTLDECVQFIAKYRKSYKFVYYEE